ncbi:UDP-glycosyltransferase [Actinidia chinensis var. chinensis]|uniref:UDP-glycosyltransferase n=1 Tax=Actinidia chinensis var. chinensis TaxID=1590841 RepID=A0A2R6P9M5_ACTCC|nr:UDP-glycosyltransferase [Actinidia chinensis var. chinensis]
MTDGDDLRRKPPHIALFPSAGMGHLTPFLRLAAMLASRSCTITLITANPTVSAAESTHISAFFSAYPRINRLEFETIPYSPTNPTTDDPFFLQFEAINRSVHLLRPLLSSLSPPLSAVVSDFAVASSFGPIANDLSIPTYVVWPSSARFLSLIRTTKVLGQWKVDTDDNEELQEVLEESFLERTKNRGIVVKEWVKQEEILAHPAIGGFVSHCGWNSVAEAARHGVPVLAWPQVGDQRANADVVERAGLGVWVREWGWGVERLVRGEEIGEKVREMMSDRELRSRAREVGEEARKAWEVNGSSEKALMGVIDGLKT